MTSCKEWNTSGWAGPLERRPYDADPTGTFFNRDVPRSASIQTRKRCTSQSPALHCEEPPCAGLPDRGIIYKRPDNGVVLVDYDKCIGCKYCSWACHTAHANRREAEGDEEAHPCIDRITDQSLAGKERKSLPVCWRARPVLRLSA